VIALLEEALGRTTEKVMLPMQPGDVPATHASVDGLERVVGPMPRTSMREGIRRFVEWYKTFYGIT
jgi:UDP-glucuronate 4-epimerase